MAAVGSSAVATVVAAVAASMRLRLSGTGDVCTIGVITACGRAPPSRR